jgi:pimeloyl-ACP methyl ester carboxylesterase
MTRPRPTSAAHWPSELGYTPVYLRYNTGRHISQNGSELAVMLAQLIDQWPVPVEEISLVVHSMGGLVIRSAIDTRTRPTRLWPQHLKAIVFLGTPHHGAPLERAGNWIDVLLGTTPFSKPFAKLGQLRSAGITDLRYGFVRESDWANQDRFKRKPDRPPTPAVAAQRRLLHRGRHPGQATQPAGRAPGW